MRFVAVFGLAVLLLSACSSAIESSTDNASNDTPAPIGPDRPEPPQGAKDAPPAEASEGTPPASAEPSESSVSERTATPSNPNFKDYGCSEGAKRCDGVVSFVCTNGKWFYDYGCNVACAPDYPCTGHLDCIDGDRRCARQTSYWCVLGKWFRDPWPHNACEGRGSED